MVRDAYPEKGSTEFRNYAEADLKAIGRRVRQARTEANLSIGRAAGLMDIALNTLKGIENGHRSVSITTLKLVALHLEVDPRHLLGGPIDQPDETERSPSRP